MSARNDHFSPGLVVEGRPGKLADRHCDPTFAAFLTRDPQARVAGDTFLAHPCVVAASEFKTRPVGEFQWVRESAGSSVRQVWRETGSTNAATAIDSDTYPVPIRFNGQTADIRRGSTALVVSRATGINS